MDFGIVALLPRATAYATGRAGSIEAAKDLPEIIGQTIWLVLCQAPLVAIAAGILWFTIPAEWGPLRTPIGVVLLSFVLMFPLRIFAAVLQGLQDLAFLGKLNISAWLCGTALTVALVFRGNGLYALAFGWVITQVLTACICLFRLLRNFPGVLPRYLPSLSWLTARGQLKQGFWISVAQIAQVLINGTDLLIIGMLLGPVAVVPYACTGKLIGVLANQPQMLMQSAFPGLSEMRMGESAKRLFEVCTALSQAMLMVSGAVVCVVLVVNQGFVQWWVGPNQYSGFVITALFVVAMLLGQWNSTWVYPLLSFGRERRISVTNLINGAMNAVLALALIWFIGAKGGPIAAILALCLVSLPWNLTAVANELKTSRWALVKTFLPWFWRFAIIAFIATLSAHVWVPNSFIKLVAATVVIGSLYSAIMLPLLRGPGLGQYVRPRLSMTRMKLWASNFGNTT
jgi:O-antigen/teichoic acid export membrane protein